LNKKEVVEKILKDSLCVAKNKQGVYFAPANIALCKYWGKRDLELNLPQTSSLSVSLGHLGAKTTIEELTDSKETMDEIWINGKREKPNTPFSKNLKNFLDLFRLTKTCVYRVKTAINIPIGAGLASSAAGFAAVVGALNDLYAWQLAPAELSILGRLGSGSASRSFWSGFVEWQMGIREDGMDSKGHVLTEQWPALRVGMLILNTAPKPVSSRVAMERTVSTSPFYTAWPAKQAVDLRAMKEAIAAQDFNVLGSIAETNALGMHSLMLAAKPPILYSEPSTIESMHRIWQYRDQGLSLYFTQDAGPNLKLLFLEKEAETVKSLFPTLEIIAPFGEK
jgi:diphosphomevalonate decarboxylase